MITVGVIIEHLWFMTEAAELVIWDPGVKHAEQKLSRFPSNLDEDSSTGPF